MKHHRLRHAADTLCHMFCGWRLVNSYNEIERLGSGVLIIVVPNGDCKFNGTPISALPIAHEMQAWFLRDIEQHRIPLTAIVSAAVTADMELGRGNNPRTSFFFDNKGAAVKKGSFVTLRARCRCEIRTHETTYVMEVECTEAWPPGWPNAYS